ncbi:16S rRNA (cytidine(1402)-2'-O)-methyltransferase [Boudabousia liubingyangii]|uniref:Ribosomal RNA small subunit methyltransferase I n=1 Tax=Boudabousia liubingyangii TaxID=1921764 RepID=A0A1Q5PJU2_9ACTO|nr:16S rRNA (cytidine(1402)-2'-O)-methyltransferase [Boudabousia liubingyangii]OKL46211.1 16S rRNA (cytidine(1402)-2'-O)-methyltransferase [Boudabousia liubingyangii]
MENDAAARTEPVEIYQQPGTIALAGTPIGDTRDASPRLINAIQHADIIAAEDTRRALNLAGRLGIKPGGKLVPLHEHNESGKSPEIIEAAQNGARILVISDAGMPTVSDPGYDLIQAALAAATPIRIIPGPSAVLTALAASGLPTDRFTFEGFMPRKDGQRSATLSALKDEKRTMIFFDSPRRTHDSLKVMAQVFGEERPAAVCRELTKTHEEIMRGTLKELIEKTSGEVLGEITIVVHGATPKAPEIEDYLPAVLTLVDGGMKLKAAAAQIAEESGLRKNQLYQAALDAKNNR